MENVSNNKIIQDNSVIAAIRSEIKDNTTEQKAQQWLAGFFKNKSFFKEYLWLAVSSLSLSLFSSAISGVSSFTYVKGFMSQFTPYGTFFGTLFLCIIHALQQYVSVSFFKNLWKREFKIVLAVGVLLIYSISSYTAFQGAKAISLNGTNAPTLVNTADIKKEYDAQLLANERNIAALQQQVLRTNDWNVQNRTIPNLQRANEKIRERRELRISEAENKNTIAASTHEAALITTTTESANISIICDVAVLILSAFLAWFLYESALNYDIINNTAAATPTTPPIEPTSNFKVFPTTNSYGIAASARNQIGFNTQANTEQTPVNTEKTTQTTPKAEVLAQIKLKKLSLQKWNYKEKIGQGNTETNMKHITRLTNEIEELQGQTPE